MPGAGRTAITVGRPTVSVPVLSKTTAVTSAARWSASPPLTSSPASAPRPVATITAVGTARPIAHGQAMISTATPLAKARTRLPSPPASAQITTVSAASPITAGTNTAATRSARCWMGARVACASCIIRTICASVLDGPAAVVRTTSVPVPFTVPPTTRASAAFSTGTGSPVSIDSSTAERPSTTTPSTGSRSPGRTTTTSPTVSAATSRSASLPSASRTRATGGCRATRRLSARVVWCLARASSARPTSTSAMMKSAASK